MPDSAQSTVEVMDHYGPLVFSIAWRILPDPDEVQDIYQETFLQFHFRNSRGTNYNRGLDTLVYRWDGPPAQNPFASEVDLEFQSAGTWEENAPRIQEKFGVRLERIPEPLTYEALVLTPHMEVK